MATRKQYSKRELDSYLIYRRDSGEFYWTGTYSKNVPALSRADKPQCYGYRYINIKRVNYMAHIIAWVMHYGYWPSKTIDHIDRVRSHNWISNLREATREEQQANIIREKRGKSGFRGVYWDGRNGNGPDAKNWVARIIVKGKVKYIGYYSTPEKASEAFNTRAKLEWPDFYAGCPAAGVKPPIS